MRASRRPQMLSPGRTIHAGSRIAPRLARTGVRGVKLAGTASAGALGADSAGARTATFAAGALGSGGCTVAAAGATGAERQAPSNASATHAQAGMKGAILKRSPYCASPPRSRQLLCRSLRRESELRLDEVRDVGDRATVLVTDRLPHAAVA